MARHVLNERGKAVLLRLLREETPIAVGCLATEFKVSNRTLRYDLDNIDAWLKVNHLPQLIRKPSSGIAFSQDRSMRQNVRERLGRSDARYYVYSQKERINMIIIELLQRREYVTIDNLAEKVSVSRSTIVNDLSEVRSWLARYALQLVPLRRYGIKVVGGENALRRCVVDFLSQNLTLNEALELIKRSLQQSGSGKPTDAYFLQDIDLPFIQEIVSKLEADLGTVFTDTAFTNLVLHMAFAVRRLQMGRTIAMPWTELERLKGYSQFITARSAVQSMSAHFALFFPEDEVGYITQHILASSVSSVERSSVSINLQMLVCNLVTAVGQRIGQDLASDQQLFDGLSSHIGPALQRLQRGFQISNPYLQDLQLCQKDLLTTVAECAASLFDNEKHTFSQDEIGFITMHFSAALERRHVLRTLPNVLVVCGTGLGTASLLAARLKLKFTLNIVDTIAIHRVKDVLNSTHVDVIVTTVPLDIADVKTVIVTPFLTPRDAQQLRGVLDERGYSSPSISGLMQIVEKYCSVLDPSGLARELAVHLQGLGTQTVTQAGHPAHLGEVLTRDFICIDAAAATWEEAVRIGGGLLCRSGIVEEQYVERMIDAIRSLGPYAVIAPGIAMPHAANSAGVNRIGMSFIRLQQPVCFGKPENDPVDMLFCFAAIDKVSHQPLLYELGRLLSDTEAMQKLREAGSIEEVQTVIKDFENRKPGLLWEDDNGETSNNQ